MSTFQGKNARCRSTLQTWQGGDLQPFDFVTSLGLEQKGKLGVPRVSWGGGGGGGRVEGNGLVEMLARRCYQ